MVQTNSIIATGNETMKGFCIKNFCRSRYCSMKKVQHKRYGRKATIRPKGQFVTDASSSHFEKATIRLNN